MNILSKLGPLRNANATSALASRADPDPSSRMAVDFSYGSILERTPRNRRQKSAELTVQCPTNHGLPKLSDSSVTINSTEQGQMLWSPFSHGVHGVPFPPNFGYMGWKQAKQLTSRKCSKDAGFPLTR